MTGVFQLLYLMRININSGRNKWDRWDSFLQTDVRWHRHLPWPETGVHAGKLPRCVRESCCHIRRQTPGRRLSWKAYLSTWVLVSWHTCTKNLNNYSQLQNYYYVSRTQKPSANMYVPRRSTSRRPEGKMLKYQEKIQLIKNFQRTVEANEISWVI